jgi:hypothetical protein
MFSVSSREKILVELCVRTVLCSLLDNEKDAREDFDCGLYNLNNGSFGKKDYVFSKSDNWQTCLEDLRSIIANIDPERHKLKVEVGLPPYDTEKEKL